MLALWKGSLPAFLISLPYSTVLFASYHALRPAVQPGHMDAEMTCKIFASGAASGVILPHPRARLSLSPLLLPPPSLLTNPITPIQVVLTVFHGPLEMWKVRLQTTYLPVAEQAARSGGGGGRSVLHQLMEARARDGVRSLFR